jgi:hypothetical protein
MREAPHVADCSISRQAKLEMSFHCVSDNRLVLVIDALDECANPKKYEKLTRLSGKLFIYASTAIKFIAAKNPVERLHTPTSLTAEACQPFHGPPDKMYSLVLSAGLGPNECTSKETYISRKILGTIIAICERLSLYDLASLRLDLAPNDIWKNTDRIRAVVNVPPSGGNSVVSTFHASFVDFLPRRAVHQRI